MKALVIGAGVAGLAAAVDLARRGFGVTVVERAPAPGGKMREVAVGPVRIDAGPTVLTMRAVFEDLFAAAGETLADHVRLVPLDILARHAWDGGDRLDLYADPERTVEAIAAFAGPDEGRRYRAFCARSREIFETLDATFIRAERPSAVSLAHAVGLRNIGRLWRIAPFSSLWQELSAHLQDRRLRQLFARYATYCGSSPYLAPATLMLIAHVEREGVWAVEGGMHRLAAALAALATRQGVQFSYGSEGGEVLVHGGRVRGLQLATGERIDADAVIVAADATAVTAGLFGVAARRVVPPATAQERSLSAITWALQARTSGFPLARHNVFFSPDYAAEFDDLFQRKRLVADPTVYVCAQDRGAGGDPGGAHERLLCLVNAPATGDAWKFSQAEMSACETRTFERLERCGLRILDRAGAIVTTTPADFARMFPATGGALYGAATHGWRASFARPGARTALPGLYLAGGSTHPGAGVPMALLSGRMAAACLATDWASRGKSPRMATGGGTSMH